MQLFGLPAGEYLPLVRRAEDAGFEAVWLADHVVTPLTFDKVYPYSESGDPGFRPETPLVDVAVTLGYLAASTSRIKLGTGVFVLPMRNPFHVARSWAAVQNLSGGRALFGVGGGWMAEEYAAIGADFGNRGARMDEMLDVLALLWTGEPVEFHGNHLNFAPVHFAGAPTTPIPFVFGGHAPAALRRAALRGQGWFGPNLNLEETRELTERIDAMRTAAGLSGPFDHYVRLVGPISPDQVRRYCDSGYEHLVFSPFVRLPAGASAVDRLAEIDKVVEALAAVWTMP